MAEAATNLDAIGSALNEAHLVAAGPTVTVAPAAADEVSVGIAQLFSGFGQEYQALARQTAQFHEDFAQHLIAGAGMYAGAEATNVDLLGPLAPLVESLFMGSGLQEAIDNLLRNALGLLEFSIAALLDVSFVVFVVTLFWFWIFVIAGLTLVERFVP
ncbi:PE family protein [Mycobacterium intermedium]|uniref:PE family protein n=1 Tax=Mycobacterium intermedium TaxID=28445 RepID=A0A1E3SHC6_MYCIE|nr:PE family protein [Mycobacterium intermedium]ODR01557.1 hypothetical protein BHQ20_08750 [Mycobacterium intermedium]OPE50277.1 PE family protein [Mycobacterium intermedium]ORA93395.1 PE family protein [Mycobacterium intermedium]